jgi:hypothetical protein
MATASAMTDNTLTPPARRRRFGGGLEMKTGTMDLPVSPIVIRHSNIYQAEGLRIVDDGSIYGARLVATRLFRRGDLILQLVGRLTPAATFRSIQVDVGRHLEVPHWRF